MELANEFKGVVCRPLWLEIARFLKKGDLEHLGKVPELIGRFLEKGDLEQPSEVAELIRGLDLIVRAERRTAGAGEKRRRKETRRKGREHWPAKPRGLGGNG